MQPRPLAIITPNSGTPSETFIQRHVTRLCPGKSALVSTCREGCNHAAHSGVPMLDPEGIHAPPWARARRRLAGAIGIDSPRYQDDVLAGFLADHGVRVVLAEYLDWAWRYRWIKERCGVRYYAHAHGYDVSQFLTQETWRRRFAELSAIDGVITMSQASAARLRECGLPEDRVHVIPYGVDMPDLDPAGGTSSHASVQCIAVGRMVTKKAPIYLLDAFRRAHARCPQLKLAYFGDGLLFPAVEQYVRALELEDAVVLHGAADNARVLAAMAEADIFLQHSMVDPITGDEEGLPVAILEAMAHALPVVATRHAGIPEAVQSGESGWLVGEGQVAEMAECITRLAESTDERRRMGALGRSIAERRFSWVQERRGLIELMGLDSVDD